MAKNSAQTGGGSTYPAFSDILLQRNFEDPLELRKKEVGRKLAERIFRYEGVSDLNRYGGRYARWIENEQWASGKPPMKDFVDFTDIGGEGKKAWVNIDYKEQMKGSELAETLITYLSSNDEYPCVTAIDDSSVKQKQSAKANALYRMKQVALIADIQEKSGVQLESASAYVPNSEIEAELKFQLDYQLDKEIEFEQKLAKVLLDNDYALLKRRIYRDLVVNNFACLKVEKLPNNYVSLRRCVPKNMLYNYITSDTGKMELSYIGERYSMKIVDLRSRFGTTKERTNGLSEKDIFEAAKVSSPSNNSTGFPFAWNESYSGSVQRPYDDYSIDVFDFEIRVPDLNYYTDKTDNFGKSNIEMKKGKPNPQSENISVIVSDKISTLRGVWAINSNKMVYWGEPDITIKPYMNISQSLFSYSPIIPNNDGSYIPSIFERIIEPLREYVLTKLKIKQLISELRPASISVDIAGIRDLDLGNGETIPAHEVIRAAKQTGFQLWDSTGMNPEDKKNNPFQPNPNIEGLQQLVILGQRLVALDSEMRSLMGVSVYLQGNQVGDRTANQLVETAIESSNNVFGFLQTAFANVFASTLDKVCMLKWDEAFIGDKRTDLMNTVFSVKVEMKITAYEKKMLETRLNTALTNGLIKFSDEVRVREIKNYKLACSYLAFMEDKTLQEQAAQKKADADHNAQVQEAVAKSNGDKMIQLQKDKLKYDERMEELRGRNQKELAVLEKGLDIWKEILKPKPNGEGIPQQPEKQLPEELAALLNLNFRSVAKSLTIEMNKTEEQLAEEQEDKELQQQAVAEQMAIEQEGEQMQ